MSDSNDRDKQHAQFVGLLWKVKRRFTELDDSNINLKLLMHDAEYRADILRKALSSGDEGLRSLAERALALDSGYSLLTRQDGDSAEPVQQRPAVVSATARHAVQQGPAPAAAPLRKSSLAFVFAGILLALAMGVAGYFLGIQEDRSADVEVSDPAPPTVARTHPPPPVAQTALAQVVSPPVKTPEIPPPVAPPIATFATVAKRSPLPDPNPRTVLRIHGSNTVGAALSPALVEGYLKSIDASDTLIVDSKADPNERIVQAIVPDETGVIAVEIHAHGSSTAFNDLADETADMGQSSRPIKDEEIKLLEPLYGDMTGQASEHVIGLDGLAVVVHPSNPINDLTTDQLAALFSGKIADWSEIGGKPGPVNVYARDDKSGTYDTFNHLVLQRHKDKLAEKARRYESNERLSDDVSIDPSGIGFCGLPYVRNSKLLAIADSSDSLAQIPTSFTVGTEDYPLARRLFFYTPADARNKHLLGLVEFTQSEPGQEIVREVGMISQNIYSEKPNPPADAPDEYKKLTKNAQRLSLNFRFRTGKTELDNKSVRDLHRLVEFMEKEQIRGRQLMLFGFTDSVGRLARNNELSIQRAHAVENSLNARGLSPTLVKGYGEILPVASNSTEFGRNKNRRVEVWIK